MMSMQILIPSSGFPERVRLDHFNHEKNSVFVAKGIGRADSERFLVETRRANARQRNRVRPR
jgi:hypothetical protein